MADAEAFENVRISKFEKARDLDLNFGSGHTAYRRASLIDIYLYTCQISMASVTR